MKIRNSCSNWKSWRF